MRAARTAPMTGTGASRERMEWSALTRRARGASAVVEVISVSRASSQPSLVFQVAFLLRDVATPKIAESMVASAREPPRETPVIRLGTAMIAANARITSRHAGAATRRVALLPATRRVALLPAKGAKGAKRTGTTSLLGRHGPAGGATVAARAVGLSPCTVRAMLPLA